MYISQTKCSVIVFFFYFEKKSYGVENIGIDEGRMQLVGNVAGMEGNDVRQSCRKKT